MRKMLSDGHADIDITENSFNNSNTNVQMHVFNDLF